MSISDEQNTLTLGDASAIARRVLRDSDHFAVLVVDERPDVYVFCLADPATNRPLRGGITVAVAPDGTYLRGFGSQAGAHETLMSSFSNGEREILE